MSEIKVNSIRSLNGANGPEISGTVEMNSTGAMSLPRGDTAYRGGRGRGLFGGSDPELNTIDYITIANTGNAVDFGDLVTTNRSGTGGITSSTRSVHVGGVDPDGEATTTQFLTIASQGNAIDYGDLTRAQQNAAGLSNSVRGICAGGETPSSSNVIDFFTISVGGTAVDFGDLSASGPMGGGTSNAHGGLNDGYQGTRT